MDIVYQNSDYSADISLLGAPLTTYSVCGWPSQAEVLDGCACARESIASLRSVRLLPTEREKTIC